MKLSITILLVALVSIIILWVGHILQELQDRITTLERNYQHLLHRINAIEYPEVLGKTDKKASKSDG